ncbi:MAG: hypothetical protein KME01_06985 [Chroococcus sp. CMT-3BRIN-NPC107]|nr:hypothetical protein [Chroococcus sp. CMT-3BRIN-NPC107]
MWYALKTRGRVGFTTEAETCILNAQYLYQQLQLRQYTCVLNAFSNTVVFAKPSKRAITKWHLAVLDDWAHIVVMQNITKQKLDAFLEELDFSFSLQAV